MSQQFEQGCADRLLGTLTVRFPDDKHERLNKLVESRNIGLNQRIEELSTAALAKFDWLSFARDSRCFSKMVL